MSSENVIGSDTERLRILLKIAREQKLSFDVLDDWTYNLDWREFQDWSEIFLKEKSEQDRKLQVCTQSEIAYQSLEPDNDNASIDSKRSGGD